MKDQLDPWAEGVVVYRSEVHSQGRPSVVLCFAVVDGRAECVRIELGKGFLSGEDPGKFGARFAPGRMHPLTTATLRDIPLHAEIKKARAGWVKHLQSFQKARGGLVTPKMRREARIRLPVARDAARRDRPRPTPLDKAHFEKVALVYSDAYARGEPPDQAVAACFQVSHSTAGRWVGRARNEFHLLPKTSQGKAKVRRTRRATTSKPRGKTRR